MKYVYGPVSSWRLGPSLGVDLLAGRDKACNFNCVYCQLGRTKRYTLNRSARARTSDVLKEIGDVLSGSGRSIEYVTFSGRGEPLLASNLGSVIAGIKKRWKVKVAVITNSACLCLSSAAKTLRKADIVMAKLDAPDDAVLGKVNGPARGITFQSIMDGIKSFRRSYGGKLALQLMFVKENAGCARELAGIARDIGADEVQLNTPLRRSLSRPLSKARMDVIRKYFRGMKTVYVYGRGSTRQPDRPLDRKATALRRGRPA